MPKKTAGNPERTQAGRLSINALWRSTLNRHNPQSAMRIKFQAVQSAARLMAAIPESRRHIASATRSACTASETMNLERRVMTPANDQLTDGGPPVAFRIGGGVTGPPFDGAPGPAPR